MYNEFESLSFQKKGMKKEKEHNKNKRKKKKGKKKTLMAGRNIYFIPISFTALAYLFCLLGNLRQFRVMHRFSFPI